MIMNKNIYYLFFVLFALNWQAKAQFSENFDTGVPGSMTQVYLNNSVDWTGCNGNSGPAVCPYNGAGSAQLYETGYNDSKTALVTPVMDLSSGAYQLKFSHVQPDWSDDQNILTVEISTDNGASWTQVVQYLNDISDWVDELIYLDNFNLTATTQIRFIGTLDYGYAIGLDDVVIEPQPSCLPVSDLSASNFTTDSAELSWTENGSATAWNIEYGPAGFTQGNGTVVAVSNSPYILTGLSTNTIYDYYVQADCGNGDLSIWEGPFTFSTAGTCGFYRIDLIDSFGDGWNGGSLTVYVNGTAYLSDITLSDGYGPESHYLPVDTGDILSFEYTAGTYGDENEYIVYDNTDTVVADQGANDDIPGNIGDPSIPSGLQACAICPQPSNLSASNITATQADLSWDENGTATAWNIEYGPAGFTLGQGTTVAVTNNPYTLTALNYSTDYDFYVQADCGNGDTSTWSGPFSFTTLCPVSQNLPYSIDFDSNAYCWSVEDANGDNKEWSRGTTNNTAISCVSDSNDYVMFMEGDPNTDMDDWLFSPGFNLTANTDYTISFSYGNDDSSTHTEDLDVYLTTAPNSTDALNGIQFFSETGISDGCHDFIDNAVTVPNDRVYYIAFHGKTPADQGYLMLDDFSISPTPGAVNELTGILGIYPNPTTGKFVIKSHDLDNAKVFVYSMSGKEIYHSTIDSDAYSIDLRNVKNGVYFVKITSDNKSYIDKLIVK